MASLVRPLEVLDLPSLKRYRRSVLPLDSAAALTRGNPLTAARLLVHLDPRRQVYTAIWEAEEAACLGQVASGRGEIAARLTFVAPPEQAERAVALYEHLIARAAHWGKLYLMAEVEEQSTLYPTLRLGGFTTYAWQRIWVLPSEASPPTSALGWSTLRTNALAEAQSLYAQIVPSLLQPIEPPPRPGRDLICRADTISAWARVVSGARGIWVQPLLYPDSDCAPEHLLALRRALSPSGSRPVYVCVRSYQAWLEPLLEDLGAQVGPRQAVMVKRLAITQKAEQAVPRMGKAWVRPTAS